MRALTCVIMGDVNIDYVTDLSNISFDNLNNVCIYSNVSTNIGGNGMFFAEAAEVANFNSIKLICSLGDDVAGKTIKSYFENKHIDLISIPSDNETGKVIIIFQPEDKRILIVDRGANETIFNLAGDNINIYFVPANDLLYISGYYLLSHDKNMILPAIIQKYHDECVFSIIDVVPHEIFNTFSWEIYKDKCNNIDGIVMELQTAIGFMQQEPQNIDIDIVADFLLDSFKFCLVRLNSNSDFLIADTYDRRVERFHYHPRRVTSQRFTDSVTAQILYRYINDRKNIFVDSKWVDEINMMFGEMLGE